MDWNTLATPLFGPYHGIAQDGDFLQGNVMFEGEPLTVIGTTEPRADRRASWRSRRRAPSSTPWRDIPAVRSCC